MFQKIFVEEEIWNHPSSKSYLRVKKILDRFNCSPILISKVENYFGRVQKPYLQKQESLNLYLGKKKGNLVKLAPPAYGLMGASNRVHYYFIYSYNCVYECEYCFLQGYFPSSDLVFFVNHEEIIDEMKAIVDNSPHQEVWFHGGEFSDSLALSNVTDEWPLFWNFFENFPKAKLELRTKSAQIKSIIHLPALDNVVISFSLNPEEIVKKFELKTPSLRVRLLSIEKLLRKGFRIGIHLDPIIFTTSDEFKRFYTVLIDQIGALFSDNHRLEYISLGTLRFTKSVYQAVRKNYPDSELLSRNKIVGFDQKIRYPRPKRIWMMNFLKEKLLEKKIKEDTIYYCMEN